MALSTKLSAAQAYSRRDLDGDEACFLKGRAGTRVGANYRAACRARSHADFVNKMGHVVEEADESVYWLELIRESGICQHSDLPVLRDEAGPL